MLTAQEKEEMRARLRAALKPKPKSQPPTTARRVEERFAAKRPTEAILQDAIRVNGAVKQRFDDADWLEEERRKRGRAWQKEQDRFATNGVESRHRLRRWREEQREFEAANGAYQRQLDEAWQSMRDAQAALNSYVGCHRGPGDPDWGM